MSNATQATKATPPGWPRISSAIFYEDPAAAIDWIIDAFGFELVLKVEGDAGEIVHSELRFGDGLIMVGGTQTRDDRAHQVPAKAPKTIEGANTQTLCIFVDDVDAHRAHVGARPGATIIDEPETHDYGEDHWADRSYRVEDPEGHHWWFMQRVRGPGA